MVPSEAQSRCEGIDAGRRALEEFVRAHGSPQLHDRLRVVQGFAQAWGLDFEGLRESREEGIREENFLSADEGERGSPSVHRGASGRSRGRSVGTPRRNRSRTPGR